MISTIHRVLRHRRMTISQGARRNMPAVTIPLQSLLKNVVEQLKVIYRAVKPRPLG